jgi:hypothetical protein
MGNPFGIRKESWYAKLLLHACLSISGMIRMGKNIGVPTLNTIPIFGATVTMSSLTVIQRESLFMAVPMPF